MQSRLIFDAPRTYALILETGDEAMLCLSEFAQEERLHGSQLSAIGAFSSVVLGYFEPDKQNYKHIQVFEQVEVVSLLGDIALDESDQPKVHVHVVISRSDGAAMGGHLLEGYVRPTLEIILTETPAYLRRYPDPNTGLALIRL